MKRPSFSIVGKGAIMPGALGTNKRVWQDAINVVEVGFFFSEVTRAQFASGVASLYAVISFVSPPLPTRQIVL